MNEQFYQWITRRLSFSFRSKIPEILQTEASECGLACLAMISGFYGINHDLFSIRERFSVSSRGLTLKDLVTMSKNMGMQTRALSLEIDELKLLRCPCILHWDLNHFVVLVAVNQRSITIMDPARGKRKISFSRCRQHFTGIALELWPGNDFTPVEERVKFRFSSLLKNIIGLRGALTKIFSLSLIIESINLLLPMGTQLVMDHVLPAEDAGLLMLVCLGLFSFILFRTFVSFFRSWITLTIGALIDVQWKGGLFSHLLDLPSHYFEKRKLGDIQSRFNSLETLHKIFTTNIVNSIIDTIMSVGLIVMMYLYGGWLLWVVIAMTLIYVALRLTTWRRYRNATEDKLVRDAKADSHFMETLYGINTIRSLGLTQTRAQYWLNLSVDSTNAGIKLSKLDMLFGGVNNIITAFDQVIILWLGATMVIDGNLTIGMFVAFNAYRGQFGERAASLVNMLLQLRMLGLHNERVADIVLTPPEDSGKIIDIYRSNEAASLELQDIGYQYDAITRPIFSHLSLRFVAGESVAIVGPSGLGKTTLMKVMTGQVKPDAGKVMFNGMDIHAIGLNNYRRCIACVLQDDKLFSGSIADNICAFTAPHDDELMRQCAEMANIHNDIMAMPMGYETLISELGGSLSGGQKQRLLIARALYRQPMILFMDEATSHLDLENEAHINQAIATQKVTRIIIAHRPSTIASADRVINLADELADQAGGR
ncbi:peptidase domain-containing ABC transporter [Pantoea sp.]|uniref:peptidase domain-containing ABC transporter n=1 Tax=Pantoea sp. TaxID=69393 RepID=UPI002897B994|nr:peptidase domain-containing ABC transporter [Pantoea sp.]